MQAQTFSLQKAIESAQENTIEAARARSELNASSAGFRSFQAGKKAQLSLFLDPFVDKYDTYPFSKFYDPQYYNPAGAIAELRLTKDVTSLGGKMYVNSSALWVTFFDPDYGANYFYTVPLSAGYKNELIGFNAHKWDKKINFLKDENSRKEYASKMEKISLEAVKYYMNWLEAKSLLDIAKSNTEVSQGLYEIGKEKLAIATITKNELIALELQYLNAQNHIFTATGDEKNARNALFSYLRIEDEGQDITLDVPDMPHHLDIDPAMAMDLARKNDPESMKIKEQNLEAQKALDKAVKESGLQVGVDLSVGMQYNNNSSVYPNFGNPSSLIAGGVSFKIPIVDHGLARSRKDEAEYRLESTEQGEMEAGRKIDLQVSTALSDFNIQQDMAERTASARALAEESYQLVQELYSNGDIDINTFVLAQNRKDEAYKNYLSSLKKYWISYYTLRALCLYDFINNHPL